MARSTRRPSVTQFTVNPSKSCLRRAIRNALHCGYALGGVLIAGTTLANPQGGQVVSGIATIQTPNESMLNVVQSSQRAIIDWRSFSIGANEQVNFQHPSIDAATLNRVTGGQQSVIDGALNANGNVYLLNSSGVLFGNQARVDVGGLLTTTSQISNDDFMEGRLNFRAGTDPGAAIENLGQITIKDGGIAALVAPTVRNAGVIRAQLGRIALAGGEAFTVDLFGDRLINFTVPAAESAKSDGYRVEQSGQLIADSGAILLSASAASDVVGGVVNMSGISQARTASLGARGEIILSVEGGTATVSGTLDATGNDAGLNGGNIRIYADDVTLTATAAVDASGTTGGGTVHIGGGIVGDNTPRARATTIDAGATIDVSATAAGNGGTAAVWGTDHTQFEGSIAARGGSDGGNGGFVEVSTDKLLQFLGEVFVDAPRGQAGTLLLDPEDVRIEAIGSPGAIADISVIAASRLNSILRSGANVVLTATNSITVNELIDGRPASGNATSGSVSLTAGSIIIARPVITNNNSISLDATSGSVTFRGDGYLYVANVGAGSAPQVGSSPISVMGAQNVVTDAGGGINAGQLITLGSVNITATSGNVQFRQALAGLANTNGIGALTVRAGGNIDLQGVKSTAAIDVRSTGSTGRIANETAPITTTAGDVLLLTTGPVTLNESVVASAGNVCLGAGTDDSCAATPTTADTRISSLTMAANSAVQAGTTTGSATGISIYSSDAIQAQDLLTSSAGHVLINTMDGSAATTGAVTLSRALTGFGTANTAAGIGSLRIDADGTVLLAGVKTAQTTTVSGSSIATGSDAIDSGGNVTLTSTGANGLTIGATGNGTAIDSRGTVTLTAGSTGAITINRSVLTNGGDISVVSGGAVTMAQAANLQTVRNAASSGTLPTGVSANTTLGAISVTSTGAATLGGLISGSGTQGTVTITSGSDAVLGTGLFGLDGPTSQVGSLSLTATGAVTTNGILTGGALSITGGQVTNGTGSLVSNGGNVTLTSTGSGGISLLGRSANDVDNIAIGSKSGAVTLLTNVSAPVNIEGDIRAIGGALQIGTDAAPAASIRMGSGGTIEAASVRLRASTNPGTSSPLLDGQRRSAPAASSVTPGSVWISDINVSQGGQVDIAGADVTVFGVDESTDVRGTIASTAAPAGAVTIFGARSVDVRAISAGFGATPAPVSLLTNEGGRISIRGQLESRSAVRIGLAAEPTGATNTRINLSHNISTHGQTITLNGNVILFDGLDRWAIERARLCGGGSSQACTSALKALWLQDPFLDPAQFVLPTTVTSDPKDTLVPFDNNNQVISAFSGILDTTASNPPGSDNSFLGIYGSLIAGLDTTAGSSSAASVTVNGNLGRYVAAAPNDGIPNYRDADPNSGNEFNINDATDPGTIPVYPGFVHHELSATVSRFIVTGRFGDTPEEAKRVLANSLTCTTSCAGVFSDRNSILDPRLVDPLSPHDASNGNYSYVPLVQQSPTLGQFTVTIESGSAQAATVQVTGPVGRIYGSENTTPPTWAIASEASPTGVRFIQFEYQTDSNDPGDNGVDPGARGNLQAINARDIVLTGGGTRSPGGNAGAAGAGGTERTGSLANGASASGVSSTTGKLVSTATADDKRKDDTGDESMPAADVEDPDENANCARGASADADLGQMSGVEGAAPDVHARCHELGAG